MYGEVFISALMCKCNKTKKFQTRSSVDGRPSRCFTTTLSADFRYNLDQTLPPMMSLWSSINFQGHNPIPRKFRYKTWYKREYNQEELDQCMFSWFMSIIKFSFVCQT